FDPHFDDPEYADAFASDAPPLSELDVYPDVRPCLQSLQDLGIHVGVAGNQPRRVADELRALDLPADTIATSGLWRVRKPDSTFFDRIVETAGAPASSIAYVGDQLELDIMPALRYGLAAVRILRGPWGQLVRSQAIEEQCLAVVTDLMQLPSGL